MSKRKRSRKGELCYRNIYIEISNEFSDEEARSIMNQQLDIEIRYLIESGEVIRKGGGRLDTCLDVVLGEDFHKAGISLRQTLYYKQKTCDYALFCDSDVKSGDYCCTKQFIKCPSHKNPICNIENCSERKSKPECYLPNFGYVACSRYDYGGEAKPESKKIPKTFSTHLQK